MSEFFKGHQRGWYHNPGMEAGYFHTYDHLKLADHDAHKVHVFLPHGYEQKEAVWGGPDVYPTVYMNDGDTAFFNAGLGNKSWRLHDVLGRLYREKRIRKLIVVAICPNDREYEYTHDQVVTRSHGGLHHYARFVAAVKGFVQDHYRVIRQRDGNLLLGSSHGGLAAFYTACTQDFGAAAAMSPSFWVGLDSSLASVPYLSQLANSALLSACSDRLRKSPPRIYLDWGLVRSGGLHNSIIEALATTRGREMRDLLQNTYGYRRGHELFVREDPGGDHTEDSWHRRVGDVLTTFFPRG